MKIGDKEIVDFKMKGPMAVWVKSDIEYLVTNMQSLMSKKEAYGLAALDPKTILSEQQLQEYLDLGKEIETLSKSAQSADDVQKANTLKRVEEMNSQLQSMLVNKAIQNPQLMVDITSKMEDQNEEVRESKRKITELTIKICEDGLIAVGESKELINEMTPISINTFVSELMAEGENGLEDLQSFFTLASTSKTPSPQINPINLAV